MSVTGCVVGSGSEEGMEIGRSGEDEIGVGSGAVVRRFTLVDAFWDLDGVPMGWRVKIDLESSKCCTNAAWFTSQFLGTVEDDCPPSLLRSSCVHCVEI